MTKTLTCIECPMGCEITVETQDCKIKSVTGNSCPRGKLYAENEVICPKRVVTSTVRAYNGEMIPVKTSMPVKKTQIFQVMEIIKNTKCDCSVKIGDVLVKNISDGADLIVSGNF